ncbi:polysaccharide transporter, PST family [Treponema bryantii]|uniref:Polysaccharide transporter, PST family n=1 Tax=Treponema bryantii TaxID=163 RepID=A0A1H9G8Z1_9SPIR|nr:oligosaccharide flippase family protein [Treponema bryantii]SEQ46530.1 polysaccharide transporter, PST family [Treponema bryantii]
MDKAEKNLAKNTFFLYLMKIISYIYPLFTFPYITRVLGAEKYGIVVFANAIMTYFILVLEFGFLLSATNSCSIYRDNKTKLGHITIGIIQGKLIIALLELVVLFICCTFVSSFSDKKLFFYISFIGAVCNIFLPDYLFRGIEKMSIITYRVIFSKLIYTILIFVFIHDPSDYLFVPIATLGGNLIAVILTWVDIFKKKYIYFVRVSLKDTYKYIIEASPFFLSRIAVSIYTTLNTVLLGMRFSSNEIGVYGTANTMTSMCRQLLSPISDSIYPYMVQKKNYKLVKKILLILEPIIIVGCIILYFIAPWLIVFVCGKEYSNAVPILRCMIPLIIISLPTYLFGYPVLGALGDLRMANLSVMIGAGIHIIGLLILYGIDCLNFVTVPLLTFCTEFIVFSLRFNRVVKLLRQEY